MKYAIRNCNFCGIEFIPNSGKQVCCGQLCNTKKWRRNNPEKARAQELQANEKRKGIYRYNPKQRKKWYDKKKQDLSWKEKLNAQGRARYNKVQGFIREYKLNVGCVDCNYREHHAALEFDHVKGNKELNVCFSKSIKQAKKEIEKCEVVCSNCHKIRTFNRLQKTYEKVEENNG
jgi:hypothetical protein